MEKSYVFVYLPGQIKAVPAGIFSYDQSEMVGRFSYGRRYIDKYGYPISPDLPISTAEYTTTKFNGFFQAFRDNLPDYWGRTVYSVLNNRSWKDVGDYGLLSMSGAARIGNLDFRQSLDSPEPDFGIPGFSTIETIMHATESIQRMGKVEPVKHNIIEQAVSNIGGMRPKCTIEMDNSLWIAKLPSIDDSYDVAKVEAATMHMASLAGITVPAIRVVAVANKQIFLVERFDRAFDKAKNGYIRNSYISAFSLMGKHEMEPFYSGYGDFAEILRRHGDITGSAELFKRMLFNIAVRNIDDHARNHGFIISEGNLKLSPAFDVTPTELQKEWPAQFYLSITLGEQGWLATIENAFSEHSRFGITFSHALKCRDDVLAAVSQWREAFSYYEVSDDDIGRFEYTMETATDRLNISALE
jgi:serine/threonine-protein kinase HipA